MSGVATAIRPPHRLPVALCLLSVSVCAPTRADMEFPGEPVPLAQVAGKPGSFRVTLPERSPLSTPDQIIKRMHLKDAKPDDYDWAKEVYDLYVPKEPGDAGKYGLMVGAVFKDYGAPPGDWGALLDKYHVIWICSEFVGDGAAPLKRIGTMLDAAHNIRKAFPVDDARTYASMGGGWDAPVGGVPLHYADVFDGAMYTVGWGWFTDMRGKTLIYETKCFTQPDAEQVTIARTRGRYFFVRRKEDINASGDGDTEIVKRGFPGLGIQSVKMILVPREQMGHYGLYDPAMFDHAMTFLDEPLSKLPPKAAGKPSVATTPPATSTAAAPAAVAAKPPPTPSAAEAKPATASDSADKAAKDLGMAKNYLALQKYDAARSKLQKIVETYPGTPAAKEAQKLLKDIEGK